MARKTTRKALATLESALDATDDQWDPGLAEGLPDDLRERLYCAVFDANRAVQRIPKTDGRGRRPGRGPDWDAANAYLYMNPPPRGTTHFARDSGNKLFANSEWARAYAEHMKDFGVEIEQAKYIFDTGHYAARSRAKKKAPARKKQGPKDAKHL